MILLDAVGAGFAAVRRSKRLLLLTALVDGLVCLPAALYVWSVVDRAAAHRVDSAQLARSLDEGFFAELRNVREPGFDATLSALVIGTLVLFFVLRPLIQGGFVGIAATPRRLPFADFVRSGGRLYWKFVRLALLAVAVIFLLQLAAKPLLIKVAEWGDELMSERGQLVYRRWVEFVVFAAAGVTATVFDYTRVGMRIYRRKGVFRELLRSFLFVAQNPINTLGVGVASWVLEVMVLRGGAEVLHAADGSYVITSIVMILLLQLLVALREATRLFHVAGAWHVRVAVDRAPDPTSPPEDGETDGDLLANLPWNREWGPGDGEGPQPAAS